MTSPSLRAPCHLAADTEQILNTNDRNAIIQQTLHPLPSVITPQIKRWQNYFSFRFLSQSYYHWFSKSSVSVTEIYFKDFKNIMFLLICLTSVLMNCSPFSSYRELPSFCRHQRHWLASGQNQRHCFAYCYHLRHSPLSGQRHCPPSLQHYRHWPLSGQHYRQSPLNCQHQIHWPPSLQHCRHWPLSGQHKRH